MKVSNQVFNTSNSNVLGSLVPGRVIMKLVFSVPVCECTRAQEHLTLETLTQMIRSRDLSLSVSFCV